jgi:uncharacterized membrane protein (UPF0127 family)
MRRVGIGLVALGIALAGLALWRLVDGYDAPAPSLGLADVVRRAGAARAPFPGLTEARVMVGARSLRVVVADDDAERNRGLRRRRTLGPYDGMLFAYDADTDVRFTMSTVPVALDIAFYDGAGGFLGRRHMTPCAGTDAQCPLYSPPAPFRYALETLAGRLPSGRLSRAVPEGPRRGGG